MLCTPAQLFHHYNKLKLRICLFKKKETENLLDDGGLLLFLTHKLWGSSPQHHIFWKEKTKVQKAMIDYDLINASDVVYSKVFIMAHNKLSLILSGEYWIFSFSILIWTLSYKSMSKERAPVVSKFFMKHI
jgi:hypothetical protein